MERVGSGDCENWLCALLNKIQFKKRLISILRELVGQKAFQAAGKAQEGRVEVKAELQLRYPVLVMASSVGFVFLTLPQVMPLRSCPSVPAPCV